MRATDILESEHRVIDRVLACLEKIADRCAVEGRVMHIPEDMEMRDAARLRCLAQVSGAPVVDAQGCCVGVLSTSDLVRPARDRGTEAAPALPLACGFQAQQAGPDGAEVTFCTLPPGTCSIQGTCPGARAGERAVCREPHSVPTDWQVVNLELAPTDPVRRSMTAPPITTRADPPVAVVAREMSSPHPPADRRGRAAAAGRHRHEHGQPGRRRLSPMRKECWPCV